MKGWLKKVALIGAAIVTAVSLSACGKQSNSSGKKVTIEYFNQKKEMSSTLKSIIKDFEKRIPTFMLKKWMYQMQVRF